MLEVEVAICDDDSVSVTCISRIVEEQFAHYGIKVKSSGFTSAADFQKEFSQRQFSVCFLDIDMPQINGIDLAELLYKKDTEIKIVFVSAKEEMVFQSFRAHPFSFVRKSRLEQDMEETIKDIAAFLWERQKQEKCQIVDEAGYCHSFLVDSILYIEAKDKYIQVVMEQEQKLIRASLKSVEAMLKSYGMIRCHKSYIVNIKKIYAVRHDQVVLLDKTELPIRRGIVSELKTELCKYLMN